MENSCEQTVWMWRDPDKKFASQVVNFIKSHSEGKEITILHFTEDFGIKESQLFLEYLLELCHTFELLEDNRISFLSYKDHLLALELCVAQLKPNKVELQDKLHSKEVVDYHVTYKKQCLRTQSDELSEDEIMVLGSYKEFLKHGNCTDIWTLFSVLREEAGSNTSRWNDFLAKNVLLMLGAIEREEIKQLIELLSNGKDVFNLTVETPLNSSIEGSPRSNSQECAVSINFNKQPININSIFQSVGSIINQPRSSTEEYAEEVILSFLSLLGNCRNELALSKAITSPLIDLSHRAFTDIKHLSTEKDMPMCQTVMSYVTRVRLGGKGYAPPVDCPLFHHMKGLEQFVDCLNQLQTVIEEDASTKSAVKRVINIVKNKLMRSSTTKLRESSIEDVAKELIKTAMEIIEGSQKAKSTSSQIGHEAFNVLHCLVNHRSFTCSTNPEATTAVQDTERTPLNLPPLMGYFRTPEEDEDSNASCDTQISLRIEDKIKSVVPSDPQILSYFHSSNSCSTQTSCVDKSTPVKVTFKGCLPEQDDKVPIKGRLQERKALSLISDTNKTGIKRSLLSASPSKTLLKKANVKNKKPTAKKIIASKAVKAKKQIEGQGQITKFFLRV